MKAQHVCGFECVVENKTLDSRLGHSIVAHIVAADSGGVYRVLAAPMINREMRENLA